MELNDTSSPRTLILDCNRFELAAVADSLRLQGVNVIGEARDTATAHHLFTALSPDAVVINYQGCDEPIVAAIHALRESAPALGIVLLTHSPDLRLYGISEGDLPSGTQIIEKSALVDLRELRKAIDASIIPGIHTRWVANDWDGALSSLTNIQVETLRLLALGLSNSDIGRTRFVSEKSVEQTIARIAGHLHITHEHGRNMRVILAAEYFKWLGAPRQHALTSRSSLLA
jgi:DNA-binding NarL/FixJ family response regulator